MTPAFASNVDEPFTQLTAIIETATGLGLMPCPPSFVRLLLGSPLDTSAAAMLGRVAGAALLALVFACWLAAHDHAKPALREDWCCDADV